MTVVAIIGALAALGVPQYKKMQRKARRAEANMVLGVIASAEAAFFAEYNGYGNNMGGIGAEMDNAPQYYNAGFNGSAAPYTPIVVTSANARFCETSFACVDGSSPRTFPGYSGASIKFPQAASFNTYQQVSRSGFQAMQPDGAAKWAVLDTPGGSACPADAAPFVNSVADGAATYRALAAGNLLWNTAAATNWDCVTIDNNRVIMIHQDGT